MGTRAYRFRPAENPLFTIDILQNNRLFCADWRDLNDPMEGTYDTLDAEEAKRSHALRLIYEQKIGLRVCSLSKTYKSHTMWAHYASSYRGVVIEFEFANELLREVNYASGDRIQRWAADSDPYKVARDILTIKHSDWAPEQELRLLSSSSLHKLEDGAIVRVILGSRISTDFEREIRCAAGTVPVRKLKIRSGELKAE